MTQDKPRAACYDSGIDPELWYPDPYHFRANKGEMYEEATEKALLALTICQGCPFMKNGSCLKEAMSEQSNMDYGIWAGTLPYERRRAVGVRTADEIWQIRLRMKATRRGIIKPLIPAHERPKSSQWDYLDGSAIFGRSGSQVSEWE